MNSSSQYLSWYQEGLVAIAAQLVGAAVVGAAVVGAAVVGAAVVGAEVVGAAVVGAAVVGAAVVEEVEPPQADGAARNHYQKFLRVFPDCLTLTSVPAMHQLLPPTWLYLAK